MSDDTPLIEELARVRQELQATRGRLALLEERFRTDARSPEDRAVTKYIESEMRKMKREFNRKLKSLEAKR